MNARRLLLLSKVRPTLQYGSKVWESNKTQAATLESVMLGGAKRILGCSSKTCNEAVRGDMGLETLGYGGVLSIIISCTMMCVCVCVFVFASPFYTHARGPVPMRARSAGRVNALHLVQRSHYIQRCLATIRFLATPRPHARRFIMRRDFALQFRKWTC